MKKSYHSIADPAIAARATFLTVDGLGAAACAPDSVMTTPHYLCSAPKRSRRTSRLPTATRNRSIGCSFPQSIPKDRLVRRGARVNCYFKDEGVRRRKGARLPSSKQRVEALAYILSASSAKRSRESGLLRESRLAASSGGVPERIFLTGTSSFLPLRVRGISGTAKISFGTCRGEVRSRIAPLIFFFRSSPSPAPSSRTTKSGIYASPLCLWMSTTRLSWTSSTLSTAE